MRTILMTEEELKTMMEAVLDDRLKKLFGLQPPVGDPHEDLCTSLYDIAQLFQCSLPTAQKIKNSIPKNQYRQFGKTFAIPRSILLAANTDLNKQSK